LALEAAEQALDLAPEYATAHFLRGWILLDADEPALAAVAFEEGCRLAPHDVYGLTGATRALQLLGRGGEAAATARRAVAAETDDGYVMAIAAAAYEEDQPRARERLVALLLREAQTCLAAGRSAEARAFAERALHTAPESADAHAMIARVHSDAGNWNQALAAADEAMRRDPRSFAGQLERAIALDWLDQRQAAIDALRGAATIEPENAAIWKLLGDLCYDDRQFAAAAEAYGRVVDLDSDHRDALLGLSRSLDNLNRDSDADVLAERGIRLYWANRDEESLDVLRRAIKLDPSLGEARRHLGLAHVALDQWSEAVAMLGPLVEKEPYRSDAYAGGSLAFALMALDQHSRAAELSRRAITSAPDVAFGWQIRARLLNESGWYVDAMEAARQAIRLEPDTGWPYQSLAWAIERAGEHALAIEAWSDAERMNPGDLWATKGRANALAQVGSTEEAAVVYRQVLMSVDLKARAGSESAAETPLDSDDLALRGWCRLCLGDYADAVKLMISALVVRADRSVQFDLALAMLCAGQTNQAVVEYERGVKWLEGADQLRRRGALAVAIADIDRFGASLSGSGADVAIMCRGLLAGEFDRYVDLHPDHDGVDGGDG
jgi:tetratricopeptide (TPR) repeat protein